MVSLVLVMVLSLSVLVVPSYAVVENSSVSVLAKALEIFPTLQNEIRYAVDFEFDHIGPVTQLRTMNELQRRYEEGQWFSKFLTQNSGAIETLEKAVAFYNGTIPYDMRIYLCQDDQMLGSPWRFRFYDGGAWVIDKNGNFPYITDENYQKGYGFSSVTCLDGEGVWRDARESFDRVNTVTRSALDNFVSEHKDSAGMNDLEIRVIRINGIDYEYVATKGQWPKIYTRAYLEYVVGKGYVEKYSPYVATVKKETSAVEQSRPPIVVENKDGEKVEVAENITHNEDNSKVLDLTNGKLTLVDELGSLFELNIDDVSFDFDNRSYTVNAYDIKQTNNYYEYNYYTYNIQYTYNNTYVTYIGSTAEYQPKEWVLYYELPDGRSSADLTEEDIAGLSFQFNDVVNYKRSATDTSLRALYHFDGNTNDSSYWSTQGDFTWNTGASITYMESNAFNGALYLDEKTHDFTITLPSNIGSGDFSLQWRYYQNSATTSTNMDNYLTIGGQKLLQWSEHALYNGSGTKVGDLSVGTWQELALVRNKGTLHIYHNGVKLASVALSSVLTNQIVFHLGPASKAYAMLDEMRFVNFAVTQGGAAYTPTAVPYDTNSVLVLPDGAFPIAEEHWEWDTTFKPIFVLDMSSGYVPVVTASTSGSRYHASYPSLNSMVRIQSQNFYVNDTFCTVNCGLNSSIDTLQSGSAYYFSSLARSENLFVPFLSYEGSRTNWKKKMYLGDYTVSFVLSDGTIYSGTVTIPELATNWGSNASNVITCGPISFRIRSGFTYWEDSSADSWYQYLAFGLAPGYGPVDLVYLEIVPGTQANTNHKHVTAVYSSDELQPNTAAIQSDIPVKGYTVGGVRPTFPERGDVWFPVEGSRISGVYIYNGQAWEQTNARWWTGKRWIPIYAFDLVTLQDMWDVTSSEGPGNEVTPPISSDYGFWNWWKAQWLDFRAWLEKALSSGSGGGTVLFPPVEENCAHTYREKIMTRPGCTLTGTALYTCSKCGDVYTAELEALGHDWVMDDSIPDELDGEGNVLQAGYDLYTCTRCGVQHKDFSRTGPPGSEGGSTLTKLIQQLFESLGNLVGGLIDWILDLAKEAIAGFGALGDYFKEKAEAVEGFGGEYVDFFGAFFGIIPPEISTLISLALVFLGLGLFIKKVLL